MATQYSYGQQIGQLSLYPYGQKVGQVSQYPYGKQIEASKPTLEEKLWLRAALKECLAYHEHGVETETTEDGTTICLNCSNVI